LLVRCFLAGDVLELSSSVDEFSGLMCGFLSLDEEVVERGVMSFGDVDMIGYEYTLSLVRREMGG